MVELDMDERDALFELADSEGYKILVDKVLPTLISQQAKNVLHLPLDKSESVHNLSIELARYQGARELSLKVSTLKEFLKKLQTTKRGQQFTVDR